MPPQVIIEDLYDFQPVLMEKSRCIMLKTANKTISLLLVIFYYFARDWRTYIGIRRHLSFISAIVRIFFLRVIPLSVVEIRAKRGKMAKKIWLHRTVINFQRVLTGVVAYKIVEHRAWFSVSTENLPTESFLIGLRRFIVMSPEKTSSRLWNRESKLNNFERYSTLFPSQFICVTQSNFLCLIEG